VGQMIDFPSNGHTCSGYLAVPPGGSGPGVVVIQEWWGLVPHIKNVCDRFAAEGFTALAPDLYHGEKTTEPDEAAKTMMALKIDDAARDMAGAVAYLVSSEHTTGDGVGVVGFCMGGGLALYLATVRPEVKATVAYYGVIPWPGVEPDLSRINGPVLGHWGEADGFNSHEQVDGLEKRLRDAGVKVEFHWYPGCDHAFFNDDRPEVYNKDAAQLSWDRTLALFRSTLGDDAS
jgi:carboxymethylenebutenolidase